MKLLVILAAVALLVWMLRGGRGRRGDAAGRPAPPPSRPPDAMVRCAHCGLHLPAAEALAAPDAQRYYCCADHQRAA